MGEMIDVKFDFRSDAHGFDPDARSPTLRRYHQLLWSKPLPYSGALFDLDITTPYMYLHHGSELGEFCLPSDTAIHPFSNSLKHIIAQIPEAEHKEFNRISYTIGSMMVFPGNKVDGAMTINQARGFKPSISDRLDLTLECIRRHYLGEPSTLGPTLAKYAEFFELFGNFAGYVEFFLLQDLVNEDTLTVKFMMPFDDFNNPPAPLPRTLSEYLAYRERAIELIQARNARIAAHMRLRCSSTGC
jgi:Family of unknown function (DUF6994)